MDKSKSHIKLAQYVMSNSRFGLSAANLSGAIFAAKISTVS
jgi:hypothetical protein